MSGFAPAPREGTEPPRLREEALPGDSRDSLAGLPARARLAGLTADALSRAGRTGTVVAMLLVDVDDFKEVNDARGHAAGDELLSEFGRRLGRLAGGRGAVVRVSGDEFAMLAGDFAGRDEVAIFADRIVDAFAAPFALSGGSVFASASVGVATSEDGGGADELLRHAGLALHAAKSSGGRRWRRYAPALGAAMDERHRVRSALEREVRGSGVPGQAACGPAVPGRVAPGCSFALAYQPIVALGSGLIVGFEALLRWRHRTLGLLMPGQFIKIAEETGLIVPIGAWVIGRALRDLAAGGPYPGAARPYVSVNVSARQLRSPGFAGSVREALALSGLPSSALVLELTESALIPKEGVAARELAELAGLGVRLAIDDFGTGYSSLSYLHELPIDILKIDRSFVAGPAVSRRRLAIVQGVISIARNLQIEVVAEGIETADQREMLAATGCEFGQGYLLAKPMKWAQAQHLLRAGRAPSSARPPRPQ